MKHQRVWITLMGVGLLGTSLVFADAPTGTPPAEGPPGAWKQKLGLSKDHEQKLQTALQAHRTAMENLRQQRRQGLEKLRSQVQANAGDSDLQATLSGLAGMQQAIEAENQHFNQTLEGFLTPKQRAQMLLGLINRMMRRGPGMGGQASSGAQGAPPTPAATGNDDEPGAEPQ